MTMQRVSFPKCRSTLKLSLFAILTSGVLIGCDAVQLCGEHICVAYEEDRCEQTDSCSKPRQCEAAGSIRDRAPRIINMLREAKRSCGGSTGIIQTDTNATSVMWDETLAGVSISHARDMARNQFESFVGTDGLSTTERVSLAGIASSTIFESVTSGPQTAAEAINLWLDLNTDCQQLVAPDITRIGMACVVPERNNSGPYWSLLLVGSEP